MAGQSGKYELIVGSRRRQACLEEGLPVLATIVELDDLRMYEHRERENRQRQDLRPYEAGVLYKAALDEKLYPSAGKMAEALQIDLGNLGRLLHIANLPAPILGAFPSPLEIQNSWGAALNRAYLQDPDGVLAEAAGLMNQVPKASAKVAFERMVASGGAAHGEAARGPHISTIAGSNNQTATLRYRAKGSVTIALANVPAARHKELEALLTNFVQ